MNVEYRYMTKEEFWPLFEQYESQAFDSNAIDLLQFMSDEEKDKMNQLGDMFKVGYRIYLTAWVDDKLAGWSWGMQKSRNEYYMCNSAVLPEFRKNKIYSTMLSMTIEKVTNDGFQEITSFHHTCNNAVLIPKLKKGFFISGQTVHPRFGSLVSLVYFTNKKIEHLFHQRIGFKK